MSDDWVAEHGVDDDNVVAHHEAGHAVVARRLGLCLRDVTIEDRQANVYGAAWRSRDAGVGKLLLALEIDCKVALAGPCAETRYAPGASKEKALLETYEGPFGTWLSDMENAQDCVRRAVLLRMGRCSSLSETNGVAAPAAPCEALYAQLCDETKKLVAENWPAIKRVAEAVQRQRTLTEIEVDVLIAG